MCPAGILKRGKWTEEDNRRKDNSVSLQFSLFVQFFLWLLSNTKPSKKNSSQNVQLMFKSIFQASEICDC